MKSCEIAKKMIASAWYAVGKLSNSLFARRRWRRELNSSSQVSKQPSTNTVAKRTAIQICHKSRNSPDLTSSFVLSAIILWKPIPTPSMTPKKTAHMMAEFLAAFTPPRTAKEPPVKKPAITKHRKKPGQNEMTLEKTISQHRIPAGWQALKKRTGIVRILLLSDSLNRTVECREKTTPYTEVTTENGRSRFDGCDRSYPSLAVGTVSETFHTVPYCTTDCLDKQRLMLAGPSFGTRMI